MATALNYQAWSTTAASNDGADSTIGTVANGSSPTSVDDWVRGLMAAAARHEDDIGGGLVAGGTSTALTVTTNQVLSSGHIANGLRLLVRTASAATGAATIAVDGLTAVDIKRNDTTAVVSGSWASGAILDLVYSSTASAFIAANIPGASSTPAATASFSANKNASNQSVASSSATKVTFGTEAFDVGGYFSSSTWTPPSGKVLIAVSVTISNIAAGGSPAVHLYKNGAAVKTQYIYQPQANEAQGFAFTTIEEANGSDTFEVYVESGIDTSYSVSGVAAQTWFSGTMI